MIISIFTSPSTLWITISTRARTPQLVCILRNIGLLELQSIVCQIHIEKESDVWFGRHSQWLAQLADLPRQPFGLVFSLRSMQTSWGVLAGSKLGASEKAETQAENEKDYLLCYFVANSRFVAIYAFHQSSFPCSFFVALHSITNCSISKCKCTKHLFCLGGAMFDVNVIVKVDFIILLLWCPHHQFHLTLI